MISLRRANQARSIPWFVLMNFLLTALCALIGVAITEYTRATDPQLASANQLLIFVAYVILGMLYAGWIAQRQRPLYQRWLDLVGSPPDKYQGDWRNSLSSLGVMIVICGGAVAVCTRGRCACSVWNVSPGAALCR